MPKGTSSKWLNTLPLVALALVFGWAAWERLRLPLVPCVSNDEWQYLGPGLDALLGEQFREWSGKCFLYPWFLYALLRVGGSFWWIALVQGLLSLGTGGLLFGCWMELRRHLSAPRLPSFTFKLLGVLLVAVYLFSTATVHFGRRLRPEAVFPFIVSLQIYCNLRFIRARFLQHQPGCNLLSGAAAVFFSVAASLLEPSFFGAVLLANVPVIISLFRDGQPLRCKVLLVAVSASATALLLIYPEWMLLRRDSDRSVYLTQSPFSIHADLINAQMGDDLARHAATPYSPEFLAVTHKALTEALRESRGDTPPERWAVLGFNADYLRHGRPGKRSFLHELTERMGGKQQSDEFCRYYLYRAMRGQWTGMATKIARQFGIFYRFGRCPAYSTVVSFDVGEEYQLSAKCLARHEKLRHYPPGAALMERTGALTGSQMKIGPYPFTARVNSFLSIIHLSCCLWALLLALSAWRIQPMRVVFGTVTPVLLLLYAYNFGTVLMLAIAHNIGITRYSRYQFAYTLLPDFASIWLALEAFLLGASCWSRFHTSRTRHALLGVTQQ